jgi:hypothetical protein
VIWVALPHEDDPQPSVTSLVQKASVPLGSRLRPTSCREPRSTRLTLTSVRCDLASVDQTSGFAFTH